MFADEAADNSFAPVQPGGIERVDAHLDGAVQDGIRALGRSDIPRRQIWHGNHPVGAEDDSGYWRFHAAALRMRLDQSLRQAVGERHDRQRGVLFAENRYYAAITDIKVLALEIFQVPVDHAAFRVRGHPAGADIMNA